MRNLDGGPGPGVMPLGLAALMVLLAVRLLPAAVQERVSFGHLGRIGIMVAAVFLYTAVLERLGFVLATSILMVVLLVTFNERYRAAVAALGVLGTVLTFQLFYSVLKVQLPPDPWGLWR